MKAAKTFVLEDAIPHPPTSVKSNLNNIIELTEQQEPAPSPQQQSNQDSTTDNSHKSSSWIKRYSRCLCNLWRFCWKTPARLELDVNDAQFASVISQIRSKKSYYASVLPPQKQKRKVLVLDLDETLIHTSFSCPQKYDYESEVLFNGKSTKIYTIKRFGLESFLFEMSRLYEIVVFTASQKLYADKVINLIDPKGRISHRLYRQHCIVLNKTYYLKNLKILGRDLDQVIIVDDNSIAGLLHPDNFYRIQQFDGNEKDRQLCRLSDFLKHLHKQSTIVPVRDHRKRFEEMEINLEEVVLGTNKDHNAGRSLETRKRQYRHKKTNSEVEALCDVKASESTESEQAEGQITASELIPKHL